MTLDAPGELYHASQQNQVGAGVDPLSWPVREFPLQDVQVPRLAPCNGLPSAKVHGGVTSARSDLAQECDEQHHRERPEVTQEDERDSRREPGGNPSQR